MRRCPSPWQASQRLPETLNEKPPRLIFPFPRLRQSREEVANGSKDSGIGGRVGARSPPDRGLVDPHRLIDVLEALDALVCFRHFARAVEFLGQGTIERVVDQGALARAGDSRYYRHDIQGKVAVRFLRLWPVAPFHRDPVAFERARRVAADGLQFAGEIAPGQGNVRLHDLLRGPGSDDMAP